MVPDVSKAGHSFKGAMAYYLHDKRQDAASPHLATAERVAWTETRNLAADGPHTATRIMIATAARADELKAAAGIKSTGRKSTAHVYAFSLSWAANEVEGLDRAEMVRAADAALKFMKADHLQAVIVCHTDRDHPHVHVILNRVQDDGRMWSSSNDFHKFSDWANRYERDNGKIVTPTRDEKWQKRREQEQNPTPPTVDQVKRKEPTRGQILKDLADAQKAQHKTDWKDWGAAAKADRKRIYDRYDAAMKDALVQHKAATKGDWAQHFRQERERARAFEAREKGTVGMIRNALEAAKLQFRQQPEGGRGMLALTFANVLSSETRRQAFAVQQDMTKRQFMAQMKAQQDARLAAIKTDRTAALIEHSKRVDASKATMIERHDQQRGKMREAWQQFYASRESIAAGPTYRTRKPQPLPVKENHPMKDQFEKASLVETNLPPREAPHEERRFTTPAPEPRPAGIIDPPHSEVQRVPIGGGQDEQDKPSRRAGTDWAALHEPPAQTSTPPTPTDWAALHRPLTAEQVRAASQPKPDGPDQSRGPRR